MVYPYMHRCLKKLQTYYTELMKDITEIGTNVYYIHILFFTNNLLIQRGGGGGVALTPSQITLYLLYYSIN